MQPEVDVFLTLQWILSNVFSMSIKFIYQDDIHSKLCLMMLRQKNMLFVHHLVFFEIYFFLSFRWYPLHLSFYQAQSCIVFSDTESKMIPLQFLQWVTFPFFRGFQNDTLLSLNRHFLLLEWVCKRLALVSSLSPLIFY